MSNDPKKDGDLDDDALLERLGDVIDKADGKKS